MERGEPVLPHGTQLLMKDLASITPGWPALLKSVKDLGRDVNGVTLPEATATRWSSEFRLIKVAKERDVIVGANHKALAPRVIALFDPLIALTDFVQHDHMPLICALMELCTTYNSIAMQLAPPAQRLRSTAPLFSLEEFEEKFWTRMRTFVSEPLLIVLWLMPFSTMYQLDVAQANELESTVTSILSRMVDNPVDDGETLNLVRLWGSRAGMPPQEGNFNVKDIGRMIQKSAGIKLGADLLHLVWRAVMAVPTEASAERAFSILKRVITRYRTRSNHAEYELVLNYLSRAVMPSDASPDDEDDEDADARTTNALPTIATDHFAQYTREVPQAVLIPFCKRFLLLCLKTYAVAETRGCIVCQKTWAQHPVPQRFQCVSCRGYTSNACGDPVSRMCSKCFYT